MSSVYTAEYTSVFSCLSTSVCIQVFTSFSDCIRTLSWQAQDFSKLLTFRLHLGPTQPPNQWVWRVVPPEMKRPGRDADPSPPSRVEVNAWKCTATALYVFVPCTWTTLPFFEIFCLSSLVQAGLNPYPANAENMVSS